MADTAKLEPSEFQERIDDLNPALMPHPSRAERLAMGKALREECPRDAHAAWRAPENRPDPVRLVLKADAGRLPDLIPLRHGRMVQSPFTFYRGSALAMADDLAGTPATGIRVQWEAILTWLTFEVSPPQRGDSFSPSTTSMKPSGRPGSRISSVLRRAS